ncbi:hypothetical protein ACFJIW_20405 [Tahibacter sp. UC22_41]|uniref:hypothetical protein n=1 Tax=Tahibacter sp. UC22_41 TaxID=3350178 RepID=UPI0036DCBED3
MKPLLLAASLSFAVTAAAGSAPPIDAGYQTDLPEGVLLPSAAPEALSAAEPPPYRPIRAANATTTRFCSNDALQFATNGPASVYPSGITVAGLSGVVTDVQVWMRNVTHADTSTLWLQLESPDGQVVGLNGSAYSVSGSPFPTASHADWSFTDQASSYAIFYGAAENHYLIFTAPIASSAYLPRNFTPLQQPAPAPTSLPRQLLSSLEGGNPNGSWRLWASQIATDAPQPSGEIGDGWCVDITTAPTSDDCYFSATRSGTIDASDAQQIGRIWRDGRAAVCTQTPYGLLQNTVPVRYDRQDFAPISDQPVCLTVTADFSQCGGGQFQIALYDSYDPATPNTGVRGHAGISNNKRISFSTRLPGNQGFTAVVNELTPGSGCPNYDLHVEANTCLPPPGDRIFGDGLEEALPPP